MIYSITAIIISVVSVSISAYLGFRNNKRSDTKDIEERIAERTQMNMKLDEIGRNVSDIKYDISATKKDVQGLSERMASVEASAKQAHHRLDRLEKGKEVQHYE